MARALSRLCRALPLHASHTTTTITITASSAFAFRVPFPFAFHANTNTAALPLFAFPRHRQFGSIAVTSGHPDNFITKKVLIYKPARTATQQGVSNTKRWCIKFRGTEKVWVNNLMGWTSSRDCSKQATTQITFNTLDEAVLYAKTQGLRCVCIYKQCGVFTLCHLCIVLTLLSVWFARI